MSSGVKPSFIDSMKIYNPQDYKLIYRVLVNIFKVHAGLGYLERNTCPLDNKGMDVAIGEYCKSDTMNIYVDNDPSNLKKIKTTLTGAPLQKLTGEFLTKCYGVVLPSATVIRLKGTPPRQYKWECSDTTQGRFMLIDKGPYRQSAPSAPLDALPKRIQPESNSVDSDGVDEMDEVDPAVAGASAPGPQAAVIGSAAKPKSRSLTKSVKTKSISSTKNSKTKQVVTKSIGK